MPPATAALDSEYIVALFGYPGSLKWTWSSIIPGRINDPLQSITLSTSMEDIFLSIFSINYPLTKISLSKILFSFTMYPFFIKIFILKLKNFFNF